jgi:hypothetical protein
VIAPTVEPIVMIDLPNRSASCREVIIGGLGHTSKSIGSLPLMFTLAVQLTSIAQNNPVDRWGTGADAPPK